MTSRRGVEWGHRKQNGFVNPACRLKVITVFKGQPFFIASSSIKAIFAFSVTTLDDVVTVFVVLVIAAERRKNCVVLLV